MKTLHLNNPKYILFEISYKEWLQNQGYSKSAIEGYPTRIRELLHHLETKGIITIASLNQATLEGFIKELSSRENKNYGGGLSSSYVNMTINAIHKFIEYLKLTKGITINSKLKRLKQEQSQRDIITEEEIIQLIDSIDTFSPVGKQQKAIIATLYGAGLRKSELENLKLEDVSFKKKIIHVVKGKGNKDRLVPITENLTKIIKEYVTDCRDYFEDNSENTAPNLFIDINGKKLLESSYYRAIQEAIMNSVVDSFRTKKVSLHTFRHSVATHLLRAGMDIEDLALFLGHTSLNSTMIYTIHAYEPQ